MSVSLSKALSNDIFNRIAFRYDWVNALLSFGRHQAWRQCLARSLPADTRRVLDLACGTAAIPLAILEVRPDITEITGVDISANMLSVGRLRIRRHKAGAGVRLIQGDALDLPSLASEAGPFDAVTTGFALRNVADVMKFLLSAYRVLKPSGSLAILEFSWPRGIFPRTLFYFFLGVIVPFLGMIFTGNRAAYEHLGESIRRFPDRGRFLKMLKQAGFRDVTARIMALGAVTLYMAKR